MMHKFIIQCVIENICGINKISRLEHKKVAIDRVSDIKISRIAFHYDTEIDGMIWNFKTTDVNPLVDINK